jgi:hypothetical protein
MNIFIPIILQPFFRFFKFTLNFPPAGFPLYSEITLFTYATIVGKPEEIKSIWFASTVTFAFFSANRPKGIIFVLSTAISTLNFFNLAFNEWKN